MEFRVRAYVAFIVASAIAVTAWMAITWPGYSLTSVAGAAVFAAMGMVAQAIGHSAKKNYTGSIAFLPYLTGMVLHPTWVCVCLVGVAALVGECYQKKANIKRAFNVAQYVLSLAIAAVLYVEFDGRSILVDDTFRFFPHSLAVISFLLCNTLFVAIAIGLSTSRNPLDVWKQNVKGSLVYDIVAIPSVYWFAIFYVKLGWTGVFVGFFALFGIRQFYMKNRLLETAYEETLELLVGAVELRDPYTSGHSQRVRKYSQIIASALQLPAKQLERIGVAALLHDVGKIDGIFVPILQKPGKLTPEERAIMELHPLKSAELVARASQLADIVDTVRHHHENWDGTGYPSRLAGTDIPLGSRIIMFADTIDAMTTDRPYRKALGAAEVKAEILKYRGSQFDPTICDILMQSPEFYRIFDVNDSGRVQSLTQMFDRVRRRVRTPAVA